MNIRENAVGTFAVTLGGNSERPVEARPEALPGDRCDQLDELSSGESRLRPVAQIFWDVGWRRGHRLGEFEHQPFVVVVGGAVAPVVEIAKLDLGDVHCSTHGRVEIQSPHAADHRCRPEARQLLETQVDRSGTEDANFHELASSKRERVARRDPVGRGDLSVAAQAPSDPNPPRRAPMLHGLEATTHQARLHRTVGKRLARDTPFIKPKRPHNETPGLPSDP